MRRLIRWQGKHLFEARLCLVERLGVEDGAGRLAQGFAILTVGWSRAFLCRTRPVHRTGHVRAHVGRKIGPTLERLRSGRRGAERFHALGLFGRQVGLRLGILTVTSRLHRFQAIAGR
jgi:hypothetical protein